MLEKGFTVPNLAEPALPGAPSWLPLPVGWFFLGGILLLILMVWSIVRLARWRRNLWRREALSALSHPHSVDNWLLLITRVRLVHQPREVVSASLDPAQWLQDVPLDKSLREQLCERYCQQDNQIGEEETQRLRNQLRAWIEGLPYV